MSTSTPSGRRPLPTAPSTLRTQVTLSASLRLDTAVPTALPFFERDFSFLESDLAVPTSSSTATYSTLDPTCTTLIARAVTTCSANNDCALNQICTEGKCMIISDAAPFEGSDSEPTSRLSTPAAIGVGLGVAAFIIILFGLGFCLWRFRGRTPRISVKFPSISRHRSASNATDQKTLVTSLPNSPRYAALRSQTVPTKFFAKALGVNEDSKGKQEYKRPASLEDPSDARFMLEKVLPTPPVNDTPLPPSPTEPKRYARNVNINKSMIFNDKMLSAASPLRVYGTPRERAPRYRFEEYLPLVATTPPVSIARAPASNKRNSEYELERFPEKRASSPTTSTDNDSEDELRSPVDKALSKLESKAPQLPLPDLPPPSPSLSFQSYDWYQDIIRDHRNGEPPTPTFPPRSPARTPTQTTFPATLSSPSRSLADSSLVPQPFSPTALPAAAGLHLHPISAASSIATNPNFQLKPTVYTMPSRSPR